MVTHFYSQNLSCTFSQPSMNLFMFFADRALNALTLSIQIFSTFAIVDPTQPNPTHGSTQPMDNSAVHNERTTRKHDAFGPICRMDGRIETVFKLHSVTCTRRVFLHGRKCASELGLIIAGSGWLKSEESSGCTACATLRVCNFAMVSGRKECDMPTVSKFWREMYKT